MVTHLFIYFYSFIGFVLEKFSKINNTKLKYIKYFYFISLLLITGITTGIRKETGGTDYLVYRIFYDSNIDENPYDYDILFVLLRNIVKTMEFSYNYFLMIISIISSILIYIFLKSRTRFPLTAFFLYLSNNYLWQNFTILRSSLSIFCIWFSIIQIEKRKIWKFLFLWLLACGFHRGALPLILLYWILNMDIRKRGYYIIAVVVAIFLSFKFIDIIKLLNLNILLKYLNEAKRDVPIGFFIIIIEKIFLTLYILLYKNILLNKKNKIYLNLIFIDVILCIVTYRIPSLNRYSHYFMIGYYIILADVLGEKWKKDIRYKICNVLIIIYFVFKFINTITSELYMNYSSWLFL